MTKRSHLGLERDSVPGLSENRDAWIMAGEICRKKFPMFTGSQGDDAAWVPPITDWHDLEMLEEACQAFTQKAFGW